MDALYLLIPLSALVILGLLGLFAWALYRGQFDDLEREGERILDPSNPTVDVDQEEQGGGREQSRPAN